MMPIGASTPSVCQANLQKKFRNLKVYYSMATSTIFFVQGTVLQASVNVYGQTEIGAASGGLGIKHLGRINPGVEFKVKIGFKQHC